MKKFVISGLLTDTASPALPYFGYRILIPNSQSAKIMVK